MFEREGLHYFIGIMGSDIKVFKALDDVVVYGSSYTCSKDNGCPYVPTLLGYEWLECNILIKFICYPRHGESIVTIQSTLYKCYTYKC